MLQYDAHGLSDMGQVCPLAATSTGAEDEGHVMGAGAGVEAVVEQVLFYFC